MPIFPFKKNVRYSIYLFLIVCVLYTTNDDVISDETCWGKPETLTSLCICSLLPRNLGVVFFWKTLYRVLKLPVLVNFVSKFTLLGAVHFYMLWRSRTWEAGLKEWSFIVSFVPAGAVWLFLVSLIVWLVEDGSCWHSQRTEEERNCTYLALIMCFKKQNGRNACVRRRAWRLGGRCPCAPNGLAASAW